MPRKSKTRIGGTPEQPISVLKTNLAYNKTVSISKIFDINFTLFLKFIFDYDSYINVLDYNFNYMNENNQPIEKYMNYAYEYVESYGEDFIDAFYPTFRSAYNNYETPAYKGIHSYRYKISLPQYDEASKECFQNTVNELTPIFKKHTKLLPGNTIFKSKVDLKNEAETEYISFGKDYIIYIIFSKYTHKVADYQEINVMNNVLNICANYIDLNVIGKDFDFKTAKSAIFDKYGINANQKWHIVYDAEINKVEKDIARPMNAETTFSLLDSDLTRHIFKTSNKLRQYTDEQVSNFVNSVIQNRISTRVSKRISRKPL